MGALARIVAPAIVGDDRDYIPVLVLCLTAGPVCQFFLVLLMAYPTKRWQSAWMGIIVHSSQSVFLAAITLSLVLK